jgi:hypothetical protein
VEGRRGFADRALGVVASPSSIGGSTAAAADAQD